MKLFYSRLGLRLTICYVTIFFLSGALAMCLLVFHTANSEFSGLFAILITLPWSVLLIPLMNSLGVIDWYSRFAGTPILYGLFALLTLVPAALMNAIILYIAGGILERSVRTSR